MNTSYIAIFRISNINLPGPKVSEAIEPIYLSQHIITDMARTNGNSGNKTVSSENHIQYPVP
jgi:hypothetical protein